MENFSLFSSHGNAKGELQILYGIKKSDRSPEEKERVIADMIAAGKRYGFSFSEYMIYGFEHKTPEEQYAFLSDKDHAALCSRINSDETVQILNDKFETYRCYRQYFNRDVCLVRPDDTAAFAGFAGKHLSLFIKPNNSWGGEGASCVKLADYDGADALLAALLAKYPEGFLAEERLQNAEPFLSLHPGSLNTVRVPTVKLPSGTKVVHPFARIGTGSSVVDNAAAGGIMGLVDPETGVITMACNEADQYYTVHPDTGVPIVGLRIPEWDKAVALAKELADVQEGLHYCGWDLAYTPGGWVMIEGNAMGQFVWQMVDKAGSRAEFEAYEREILHA